MGYNCKYDLQSTYSFHAIQLSEKKVFKHSSKQFLLKLWFVNRHVTEIESLSHIYIETKIAILQDK